MTGGQKQREGDKQTPCRAGSATWGSIPGTRDHALSRRRTLHRWSPPGAPEPPRLLITSPTSASPHNNTHHRFQGLGYVRAGGPSFSCPHCSVMLLPHKVWAHSLGLVFQRFLAGAPTRSHVLLNGRGHFCSACA